MKADNAIVLQVKGRDVGFQTTKEGEFWRILLPGIYSMEVFASGYQPREVQFAIVEQNPTLLNITLFSDVPPRKIDLSADVNSLDDIDDGAEEELQDKLNQDVEDEEDEDLILGFIPNPLAQIQKDIQSNVDSFFSSIPLIG